MLTLVNILLHKFEKEMKTTAYTVRQYPQRG
jgi:hypothetical protein